MNTSSAAVQSDIPNLEAIKAKHKAAWEDGDYASFARFMEHGAIEVLDSWNITPETHLLDVACGAGQTAIPAAKRGIKVTGIDIASNSIEHARKRASEAKLVTTFDVGDAEDLPYADNNFDVVITMFGAMFAPRPQQVVTEFARVTRSGGQLYMANWTPASMPGQMFKCVAGFVPPPQGFIPPSLWGDEETVRQRLSDDFTNIKLTRKLYPQWDLPFNESELVNLFRTYYGPVKRAFAAIDEDSQNKLHQKLEQIYIENSEMQNDILSITNGEYLEVIATRR